MAAKDWIALIDASYELDGTDEQWLARLLDCAARMFGRGVSPDDLDRADSLNRLRFADLGSHRCLPNAGFVGQSRCGLRDALDATYRVGIVSAAQAGQLCGRHPERRAAARRETPGLSEDATAVANRGELGRGAANDRWSAESIGAGASERMRWARIASHLESGWRLRRRLQALALDHPAMAAVGDSASKPQGLSELACNSSRRELLRDAVRRIDHARSVGGRTEPDASSAHWDGLAAGRWSRIDRFDRDDRRFFVAVRNDTQFRDPRGLTPCERRIADLVGLGGSPKHVAYALGLSLSAVSNHVRSVQRKLGLASSVEVALFFAATGMRARLARFSVCGQSLLVAAYPLLEKCALAALSVAERQVATLLVAGSTNADIARQRGSSERTVANQVQSLFRKLGTRSRAELAIRLQTRS